LAVESDQIKVEQVCEKWSGRRVFQPEKKFQNHQNREIAIFVVTDGQTDGQTAIKSLVESTVC
jgi:hypothetical protein